MYRTENYYGYPGNQRPIDPWSIARIKQEIMWELQEEALDSYEPYWTYRTAANNPWRSTKVANTGPTRGFLYGLGAAALVFMLWPAVRRSLQSVYPRSFDTSMMDNPFQQEMDLDANLSVDSSSKPSEFDIIQ